MNGLHLHLGSRPFVEAHGLDPDRFLPGNIWGAINQPDHFTNWTHRMYPERDIDGILVGERPNTFIRRSAALS